MQTCLELIPDETNRVFVAYSGGLDSSVLLHLLASKPRRYSIIPWHINHGLLDVAMEMEKFCIKQVKSYGLQIRIDRLDLELVNSNIEAEARSQRYHLFEQETGSGDCIVTAHHANDQAETFLLNALRGSGSAGLRGIARQRMLGDSLVLRPLLGINRTELEAYASEHDVKWFDDPSNQEDRFDRNYLRNQIVPLIEKRWPNFQNSLATTSELQSETQDVLDEMASSDFEDLNSIDTFGTTTLDVSGLLALSAARRKNLIRFWIAREGMKALPYNRLQELLKQLRARADAMPEISMPDYSLRVYDQRLFLVRPNTAKICSGDFDFDLDNTIEIKTLGLSLNRSAVFEHTQSRDQGQKLTLRFRSENQQQSDRHRLKRLFQQHRIPPWKRSSIAQIYLDGKLEGILT